MQRDTRTSGNFGGPQAGSVNLQILGNIHWLMLMLLERGSFGVDVQQAKARAVYVAGEATKRHADLPSDFILPESVPARFTWLPLTARLAGAFGWEKFYQKPDVAEQELSKCDHSENVGAAKEGHRYVGPVGGYKVELRDGVIVRLRFSVDEEATMHTEYRISSRWSLPSPIKKLLEAVERVFRYFENKPHHVIPFDEAARQHLLGCQLEQSLLVDDSCKVGDTIGEAQHGQAAGQIGIYGALLAILRWAATPSAAAPAEIRVAMKDIELAEIIIRVSLAIKKELRAEVGGASASQTGLYIAPEHRALTLDVENAGFANPYSTQTDGPTQVVADGAVAGGDARGSDQIGVRDHIVASSAATPVGIPPSADDSLGATDDESSSEHPGGDPILTFEDLPSEEAFYAQGLGNGGAHLCKDAVKPLVIEDRRLMRKLFMQGKSSLSLKSICDIRHAKGRCTSVCVAPLLMAFAAQFPRLVVYESSNLHFREFPQDGRGQDLMHNDCMSAVRLTLKQVSEARVKWMSVVSVKRELDESGAEAPAVVPGGAPPAQRRRLAPP